jgi:hypothetical protein
MTPEDENAVSQAAYLRLKDEIDTTYPKGRFVAIYEGRVVADAETFDAIQKKLDDLGIDSPRAMVVQAGDETPDYIEFLGIALSMQPE